MIKKIFLLVLALTYVLGGQVFALSPENQSTLNTDSLYYWPGQCTNGPTTGPTVLSGGDNEQQAFNFFVGKGLSAVQAAAVVGNLMDESSLNPTAMQIGGDSQNPYDAGSEGWGIAQWSGNSGPRSTGDKVTGIYNTSGVTGPVYTLATQLNMVWWEMTNTAPTGYKNISVKLEAMTDLSSATTFFQVNFEGGVAGQRQQDAAEALKLYGSSVGNSGSATPAPASPTTNPQCSSATGTAVDCTAPPASATPSTVTLSPTRQAVVCVAEQELSTWETQPGYATANFPYAGSGLLKYTQGWYELWCADFVSWVYYQAGYPLQAAPDWMIPGVSSIQSIGQANKLFHWHPQGSGYTPQPGDIAIHGSQHTNIFISSTAGESKYIGGDQGDYGPYGAQPPTKTPPNPHSESIVSIELGVGYYANGITGYVSPD